MKERRETEVKTKNGIILYKSPKRDQWQIDYPDGAYRYGGIDTIKLMALIYYLGKGKSLNQARKLVFKNADF